MLKIAGGSVIYPYSLENLRADNPHTCFPANPAVSGLGVFGVYPVKATERPSFDWLVSDCVERTPEKRAGEWYQVWEVVAASEAEKARRAKDYEAELRDQFKAERAIAVANIRVTSSLGRTFDGDEESTTRMLKPIKLLENKPEGTTTLWVLSDNTPAQVGLPEFLEVLELAGLEQTRLWVAPHG